MKKLLIIFFLFGYQLFAQDLELNLKECIGLAIKNNENLKNSILEQNISKSISKEYLSIGLPQLSIDGGLNYNYEVQKSLIDISNFMPGVPKGTEQEVQFGQTYDGRVDFNVNQMIFNGSYFVGLAATKELEKLSNKLTRRTEIDIYESVSKAYYTVLNTKSRIQLVNSNIERLSILLEESKQLYDNGFIEKLDIDRITVSFNNLQSEKIKIDRLYDLSLLVLKFQIGIPLTQGLKLLGNLNEDILENFDFDLSDFDYNKRIEYSILKTDRNLKSYDLKNNRSQYLPQIYANYNYGYNSSTSNYDLFFDSNRWKSFGKIGLQVVVPIFDGFLKRSKINQSKYKIEQIDNQLLFLERSIDLQLNQSVVDYSNSKESLEITNKNLDLALSIYKASEKKYKEGVGSNLEVLNANTGLKQAQNNYYNAVYELIISKINLEKTLGTLHNN
jgi:outer membrane protein|tara:strand:- start:940 stop:2274 length:1335 start_codon:yes stop_codon:yes gene_type:complete